MFLNDVDKMQKEQRQCKIYLLGFLPCYHTPKNKTPRGPDAQSWTWSGFLQFQHPSMKATQFVYTEPQPSWAGNTRMAPSLSYSQSFPQHPLNSSPWQLTEAALFCHEGPGPQPRGTPTLKGTGANRDQDLVGHGDSFLPQLSTRESQCLTETFILFHAVTRS